MASSSTSRRWIRSLAGTATGLVVPALAVLLLLSTGSAPPDGATRPGADPSAASAVDPMEAALGVLEGRAERLEARAEGLEGAYRSRIQPVEAILAPFHADSLWVRRVALALVREGERSGIDPRALASVVLVENPWLDPEARSPVGAVGLMQVMPEHAGGWGCEATDLTHPETNICHGTRILARNLERTGGDLERALLAYNGCVRGTNTPDCHLYPGHVYARAGQAVLHRWLALGAVD